MFSLTILLKDIGHLSFLEEASKLGDFVIAGVHTDSVSRGSMGCSKLRKGRKKTITRTYFSECRRVVVVTQPLPMDGGMAEDHGPQKLGNSPGFGPEVVETESRQRASCAKSPKLDSAE